SRARSRRTGSPIPEPSSARGSSCARRVRRPWVASRPTHAPAQEAHGKFDRQTRSCAEAASRYLSAPMRAPTLTLKDVRLADGPKMMFDGVDLGLEPRVGACLVGRNGTGKSTLLRIIAGEVQPDEGERTITPGTRISLVRQEPEIAGA